MVLQLSESEEHLRPTSPALPVKSNEQKLPKIKESDLHYLSAPRDKRRDLILRLPEPCKVPAVILVTGASKGIGLGFVKKFLAFEDVSIVIGTVRDNSGVQTLSNLNDPRLHAVVLDVTDPESVSDAADRVQHIIGDQGINLLINNAGVFEPYDFCGKPDRSKINHSIAVNTIGPILVLQKFAKFLRNAAKRSAQLSVSVARAAFVNLAPVQSSLHANIYGSNFAGLQSCLVYAATKSALNQLTRGMSADLLPEGIMAVSMMPGSVKTALGGQNAELTVEQSCELMVSTLLKLQQHHSGEFLSLQGYKIEF